MLWVLESGLSDQSDHVLEQPALERGHSVIRWSTNLKAIVNDLRGFAVFHGSMDVARSLVGSRSIRSFCDAESLMYTSISSQLRELMLNIDARVTTVRQIVHAPMLVASHFGTDEIFVRPNSPFKQFSGRTLQLDASISFDDFDVGYYYDDVDTEIIVATAKPLSDERRVIMVSGYPVAWSAYDPKTRTSLVPSAIESDFFDLARIVGQKLRVVDAAYTLDLCYTLDGPRVIEINPFSSSELYSCELEAIVDAFDDLSRCVS